MDSMKRTILGLSIALLLLLLFCSWFKADKILLAQNSKKIQMAKVESPQNGNAQTEAKSPVKEKEKILFGVVKKGDRVEIDGKFYDDAQMRMFGKNFDCGNVLEFKSSDFSENREPDEAMVLANKLAPLLKNYFADGSITYDGKEVVVAGILKDEDGKATLVQLLKEQKVPYRDDTTVLQREDSYLEIVKAGDGDYKFDANLSSMAQKDNLLNIFKMANIVPKENSLRIDDKLEKENWSKTVEAILPILDKNFQEGRLYYIDGKIGVEGKAYSDEARLEIEKKLKESGIPYFLKVEKVERPQVATAPAPSEEKKAEDNTTAAAATDTENQNLEAAQTKEVKAESNTTATADKPQEDYYANIHSQMTEEQRELSQKIEEDISELLKVGNITFKTGSAKLTQDSKKIVNKIAEVLKKYPAVSIEIAGHTDNTGNAEANLKLSKDRVESVKDELISLGIDGNRLQAVGYGQTRPKVPNDTKAHRRENRRVEFHIIKILEEVK